MSLLDLKTDLKSLKYGKDRPGGGDSGQPYQKVDINTVDSGFNRFRMTKFDDGLVRGGVVGAANAAVVDTLRIGKFLTDFPKGPLFIVKQVGLQLSNPILEHKTNFTTDKETRGQGLFRNIGNFVSNTANKILNAVGPTRIYNLGVNTLAQVPLNAFGQHIVRHGFLPKRDDDNSYFKVAIHNNDEANNRLIKLTSILEDPNADIAIYLGGPSSVYGIGSTIIHRRGKYINLNQDTTENEWAVKGAKEAGIGYRISGHLGSSREGYTDASRRITSFTGVSDQSGSIFAPNFLFFNDEKSIQSVFVGRRDNTPLGLNELNQITNNKETVLSDNSSKRSLSYTDANEKARSGSFSGASNYSSSSFATNSFNDPNLKLNPKGLNELDKASVYKGDLTWTPQNGTDNEVLGQPAKTRKVNKYADLGLTILTTGDRGDLDVTDFTTKGETTIAYPSLATGNAAKYAKLRAEVDAGNNIQQNYFNTVLASKIDKKAKKYNAIELNRTNDIAVDDDTLALQFIPLDPFTGNALNVLKFLGYITDYSENYDSNWNSVKYVGRAENFYTFNEFKRTANVGFNIPCYNYRELLAKHCILSELASTLAGKYKDDENGRGLLGGIITKLKVGNYINNQPGIITNLNFSPIQDSSWDLDAQLAFYIKVSFGFTIIHNYLPQYTECGFIFKTPDPEPPTPPPPPEIDPAPVVPQVTSSIIPTNNTDSFKPLGRVDLRDRPDTTFVRKPYILDDLKKIKRETVYGGGSYGGGGQGDDIEIDWDKVAEKTKSRNKIL